MNLIAVLMMFAMLATVIVLLVGVAGFLRGGSFNERYGNKLMRARVSLQLVAVMLLGLLLLTQS
jgi:hypothetical protein